VPFKHSDAELLLMSNSIKFTGLKLDVLKGIACKSFGKKIVRTEIIESCILGKH